MRRLRLPAAAPMPLAVRRKPSAAAQAAAAAQ